MSAQRGWTASGLIVLVVTGLLVAACSSGPRPASPASSGQSPGGQPAAGTASDPFAAARTMTLDELHQKALPEGGTLVFYGSLAQLNAEKILPAFEQRFPGIKVDHVDATSDKLVARLIAEARGGRVLADVFSTNIEYVHQVNQQGFLLQDVPPEAMAYPEDLRGKYWVASNLQYLVAAWNTNLVRPEETPRQFEDFADPRWRGRLAAEPRDLELLLGLARKHGSEEKAVELLKQLAANNIEFHRGHSELAELLSAGQVAVCLTCYAHHFPPRTARGAPLEFMRTEGIGLVSGTGVLKDAPHPYTAMLWYRWVASEEGQQAYADGGRSPAHPKVADKEQLRPATVYALGADEMATMNKYERVWKDLFQLR